MMSLPVYQPFSGRVMFVPIVGNPMKMRDVIDAPNKKVIAGPVAKKSVPDFLQAYPRGQKATQRCQQCHRDFFGDTCFQMHLVKDHAGKPVTNLDSSVCFRRRRCSSCGKQEVGLDKIEKHQCGYIDCPSCHEYVDGAHPSLLYTKSHSRQEEEKEETVWRTTR